MDFAFASSKVCVEVDGPGHFIYEMQNSHGDDLPPSLLPSKVDPFDGWRKMNGSTMMQRRILKRLGWEVVSVPFYEWKKSSQFKDEIVYGILRKGRKRDD